jgi:hypothetical protein
MRLREWSTRTRGACQFDVCERPSDRSLLYQTEDGAEPRHWFLCDRHAALVRMPQEAS